MSTEEKFKKDIDRVGQVSIVPTMLEVVCKTTGMGFAAVARVTHDRWIACSVRDEIQFGLQPGGELKVETTICNEIRDSGKAVIIDNVKESEEFCDHHTPKMYGFQSYISFPIILKNGEFFGTLCAIDPNPASLNNSKTIGMFTLFAELISFHLESVDLLERNHLAVQELNKQLTDSIDENRQYHHISNHNLQEPLRKLRVFSDMLVNAADQMDIDKIKEAAVKINSSSQRFSMMIKDLSDFSKLSYNATSFEMVNLNKVVDDVCNQLGQYLQASLAIVNVTDMPSIPGIALQIEQLFYHLISNSIKFSKRNIPPVINVYSKIPDTRSVQERIPGSDSKNFVEIYVEDNGIGIERSQLEKIFDIFSKLEYNKTLETGGVGLAYCRKIIRNHGGFISAESEPEKGTTFIILLPVQR